MNFQAMHKQRKLILIAAAIGVISVFLPWISVSMMGMGKSINGFHGFGILVFIAFIGAGLVCLAGDQTKNLDKTMWMIAIAAGAIALLGVVISLAKSANDVDGGFGFVEASFGIGIWLALIVSVAIVAVAWMFKSPEDSIKSGFESLKKSIPITNVNATPPVDKTNKIDELEKLIDMKNKGAITEEEYQQLKSKLL